MWKRLYGMIPFILHSEKGKMIAAENRSVVARDWEYEEAVTIKQQERDFLFLGVDEIILNPDCGFSYINLYMC